MLEVTLENLWLEPLLGRKAKRVVPIDHSPFTIGRDPAADYCVDHPYVSRRHCRLTMRGKRLWIHDLASLNGTYVNGRRVWNSHPLGDGDLLSICFHLFRVKLTVRQEVEEARDSDAFASESQHRSRAAASRHALCEDHQSAFAEQHAEACLS
jgi:pSer/pThr/pTyr-binding forkhead associated (FHA) protein